MSDYREMTNIYKAKRTGQIDAKVVKPKGKKRKTDKPWCVVIDWGAPWRARKHYFTKEEDARKYSRKYDARYGPVKTTLLHNEVEVLQ